MILNLAAAATTSRASQGITAKDLVSPIISIAALLFTIGTFWWNNWRRGKLVSDNPRSYALTYLNGRTKLLLPLAMQNTGPRSLLVRALRLKATAGDNQILSYVRSHTTVDPNAGDVSLAANFVLSGREAQVRMCEFEGESRSRPAAGTVGFRLEAFMAHTKKWEDCGQVEIYVDEEHVDSIEQVYAVYDNGYTLPK